MARKPLIAGNWKMFGRRADLAEITTLGREIAGLTGVEAVVCPPTTLLAAAALADIGPVKLGAQDCASGVSDGPHTGDISGPMLADAGATYCIVGHSERRTDHNESNALVRAKAVAAQTAGLVPIVCVGESREDREQGRAEEIVTAQLDTSVPDDALPDLVVAYEPVWAIGTGRVPVPADIEAMHAAIKACLARRFGDRAASMRVLYGGSVKPANAAEIFAVQGVDGALVGGASLRAVDFIQIIRAHPAAERR